MTAPQGCLTLGRHSQPVLSPGCTFDLAVELDPDSSPLAQPQHWVTAPDQASRTYFAAAVSLIPIRTDFLPSAQLQLEAYAKAVPPEQA